MKINYGLFFCLAVCSYSLLASTSEMQLTSNAFEHGTDIPLEFTCLGKNVSPPLSWKNIPLEAKSLVLIIEDPDAPDPNAPTLVWNHWIVYNLDPNLKGISKELTEKKLPLKSLFGLNSWNAKKYAGPCPIIGNHRYFHRLYALDVRLEEFKQPTVEVIKEAMKNHILAQSELMGRFEKK